MITVAVEGDTDAPFVTRLCEASGFQVRTPLFSRRGKDDLAEFIVGFARASHGAPHLVVRDLDHDASCAAEWLHANRPKTWGRFFALRIAVRAIESWFLADRKAAAEALRIPMQKLPLTPDDENDPKQTIVNLARASSKASVRAAIVPSPGRSRKTAPGYEGWLLDASTKWSLGRAVPNSPSLERAHRRLSALHSAWMANQS